MQPDIVETLVEDFERGLLSRRQLACRLMGLGAALAVMPRAAEARQGQGSTFQATGLDHVALNVRSVPRSRDFYIKHLGTGRKQLPDFTLTGEQPDSSTWGETRRTQSSWSS